MKKFNPATSLENSAHLSADNMVNPPITDLPPMHLITVLT